MKWIPLILLGALFFGVFFLIDKMFTKLFRSQSQHRSGKAVRLNKRYSTIGLLLAVLGLAAIILGNQQGWAMIAGGSVLVVVGGAMIVYYMTFGIYYDRDDFLVTTFGNRSKTYQYRDVQGQQLYIVTGQQVVIELHMSDGRTVQLQSTMTGVYEFMDHAFAAWLQQTGRRREDCPFHDPKNSCWFPKIGE